MNNFETILSPKEFIRNKNEPLILQLKKFAPGKNPDFTALKDLKDPKDIQDYFSERVIQEKQNNAQDNFPSETVRSQLAYIAGYSDDLKLGWDRFIQVLGKQALHEIANETREAKK